MPLSDAVQAAAVRVAMSRSSGDDLRYADWKEAYYEELHRSRREMRGEPCACRVQPQRHNPDDNDYDDYREVA